MPLERMPIQTLADPYDSVTKEELHVFRNSTIWAITIGESLASAHNVRMLSEHMSCGLFASRRRSKAANRSVKCAKAPSSIVTTTSERSMQAVKGSLSNRSRLAYSGTTTPQGCSITPVWIATSLCQRGFDTGPIPSGPVGMCTSSFK